MILLFALFIISVFGNTGLHLVLHGSVTPVTDPWLNEDEGQSLRSPTPLSDLGSTEVNNQHVYQLGYHNRREQRICNPGVTGLILGQNFIFVLDN